MELLPGDRRLALDDRALVAYKSEDQLDDVQLEYIAWRVNPEREGTQAEWLAARDLVTQDVRRWRASPAFNAVYDKELRKHGVTHERIANMLETLYKKGLKGDTQAMKQYLDWSKQMLPPAPSEPEASDMTDAELAAALRDAAERVDSHAS